MSEEDEFVGELDDKELILCVKANPFLYNKSEKLYSNHDMKNLAWDSIGNSLSSKKAGAEAEHRFSQLRQRFGRERRKVIQSQPRSGAGAGQPIYTSQWSLYNELTFLTDVIKHRKTTSNYTKKQPSSRAIVQVNLPTTSSTSTPNSSSLSNLWNEDLNVILSGDVSEHSSMSEPLLPQQPSQRSSLSVASSPVSATCDSNEVSPVEQMQQAMNTCEKRVPQSDFFAKRKKQDFETCSKTIFDQSKCLSVLAKKVGDALSECTPPLPPSIPHVTEPFNSFRPDVKAMLTSIGFGLQKIPESKQLDFLITTMQLIKQYTETDVTM